MGRGPERAFSVLPVELFFNVLDQLVSTCDGRQPIAYDPSHPITKALRALTLVSRTTYVVASRYLYSNCIYLHNCTSYARFRRTNGINLGHHPEALPVGEPVRNNKLFVEANIPQHITSAFISPMLGVEDGKAMPMVRLRQIIDLCNNIGSTLKRLALDLQPVDAPASEVKMIRPHDRNNNIFLHMPVLEDLVLSYDVLDYFRLPPPNLRRLAVTTQAIAPLQKCYYLVIPSLETLIFLRPPALTAQDIDQLANSYTGKSLDVVLVDVNSNHRTPSGTRSWSDDDIVRIWECDVPISFYGVDDELILCDDWIWTHGVKGTLWTQTKRRMASWVDIERKLAGPVHMIVGGA